MKNHFFKVLLLPLLLSIHSNAQSYKPLINENYFWDITWVESAYICSGYSPYPPRRYYFSGDTVINGTTYAKSYSYIHYPILHDPPPNCPPFEVDTISHLSYNFVREDTTEQKYWIYDAANDEEFLLFDFLLEQGDTLYPHIFWPIIIDTVYQIITNDGITRKKLILRQAGSSNPEGYYIEGIGGSSGLFEPPYAFFEAGYRLMCVKDEFGNQVLEENEDCFDFIVSTPELVYSHKFSIHPNPANSAITVTLAEMVHGTELILYNTHGHVLRRQDVIKSNNIYCFDLNGLPGGMYIVILYNNGVFISKQKFII